MPIKSNRSQQFKKQFRALPKSIQREAMKAYRLWKENPGHPSLQFKRIFSLTWSVRINENYRALGKWDERGIFWYWIGTHADYDELTKHLKELVKKEQR
jgi:plasmid maintenance system killer protein